MNFAEKLRKIVKQHENHIDENLIWNIKKRCEEAAKDGKTHIYIEFRLSAATKKALEEREGLELTLALTSCYTYQINW
jgi:hypothetical protein